MMPGTSSVSRSQNQGAAQSGTALFSVNGGRPQDNNFTLDGFDSNMQMMNSPGISPPMDAIQEFKVATNTGSEFGRSMGANVSMVMKSGTRDLHGTLYEYPRNDKLDANEFFANRNGYGQSSVSAESVWRRRRRPGFAPQSGPAREDVLVLFLGRLPSPSRQHADWEFATGRLPHGDFSSLLAQAAQSY